MGLFDKLFGRKKQPAPSTGELARERLTLMLVHDRLKLTPDLLDRIKGELLEVISKYVEIDESGVDVELTHTEHSDKLVARMPVRRQRIHFERDVLEPGMGNPLVAATALAKIHQPPTEAASAPAAAAPEAAAPSGDGAPASSAPEAAAAPAAAAQETPAPAAEAAPAGNAEQEKAAQAAPAAEPPAPAEPAAPAQATAEAAPPAPAEAAAAPAVAQETPAAPAGEAAPGGPVAEGSAPVEAPAPAATPTKG
jgi:cell division topological specificity factor